MTDTPKVDQSIGDLAEPFQEEAGNQEEKLSKLLRRQNIKLFGPEARAIIDGMEPEVLEEMGGRKAVEDVLKRLLRQAEEGRGQEGRK